MKPLWVTDIITKKDIQEWKTEDIILLNCDTGKGKTTFVKSVLAEYCKVNNKKILLLVNRKCL